MKKEWSTNWLSSVQPRKQRKFRYNAPLHARQRFLASNLSPELRKRYGKRSMQVRKGDEIKVMRGSLKNKRGVVEEVDLRKCVVYVEEIKIKKVDGSEVKRPLQPSNLMITKLKLDDKKRQAILDRAGASTQKAQKTVPEKSLPVASGKRTDLGRARKPSSKKAASKTVPKARSIKK